MSPKSEITDKFSHPKKNLKNFPKFIILSTKVDNICGTRKINAYICLDTLFEILVEKNRTSIR